MSSVRHIEAGISIHCGDCREVMPQLPDCSVDSVVTDPPYHLTTGKKGGTGVASLNENSPAGRSRVTTGFMGKAWDGGDVAHDPAVWRECLRLLKPGGHLLAFGGTRTYHRLACAIEDAGFEIRDQIQWIYGSGFPKSLDVSKAIDSAAGAEREIVGANPYNARRPNPPVSELHQQAGWPSNVTLPTTDAAKQWDGWGTALKPAHEPIVLARKPLVSSQLKPNTVAENVLEWGTGGLNIDACRITTGANDDPRLGGNGSWRTDKAAQNVYEGGYAGDDIASSPLGRWPANVIHDGSDEALAGFPEGTSGRLEHWHTDGGKTVSVYGQYKGRAIPEQGFGGDSGSTARFFYCAKASQEDRDEGLEDFVPQQRDDTRKEGNPGGDNPRNRGLAPRANHHPTVKPTDLMRYLVRLVTPPGGTVLDPFCGSGSTGKACALEQMNAILIDSDPEYCDLAAARSRLAQGLLAFG